MYDTETTESGIYYLQSNTEDSSGVGLLPALLLQTPVLSGSWLESDDYMSDMEQIKTCQRVTF